MAGGDDHVVACNWGHTNSSFAGWQQLMHHVYITGPCVPEPVEDECSDGPKGLQKTKTLVEASACLVCRVATSPFLHQSKRLTK